MKIKSNQGKHNFVADAGVLLNELCLKTIPINSDLTPRCRVRKIYRKYFPDYLLYCNNFSRDTYGIGIVIGKDSGNREVLHGNRKSEINDGVHNLFIYALNEFVPGVYEKLLIQKDERGDYYYFYRSCETERSQTLSSREICKREQKNNSKKTEIIVMDVIGDGRFCACAPNYGREIIQGSYENIPMLTFVERKIILLLAILLISLRVNDIEAEQASTE